MVELLGIQEGFSVRGRLQEFYLSFNIELEFSRFYALVDCVNGSLFILSEVLFIERTLNFELAV
jgi:hypothetical protein